MKRIRDFKLTVSSAQDQVDHSITGWHKAWDFATAATVAGVQECRIFDSQIRNSPPIAIFSEHNLQDELDDIADDAMKVHWKSEAYQSTDGVEKFANLNLTDFGWSWVEGATRDLPYRLGYLERGASMC